MAGLGTIKQQDIGMENQFNTKLTPQEEIAYQQWAKENGRTGDTYNYDLRGAYKEINSGTMTVDDRNHLGDRYKKPNHQTFSNQSIYSIPNNQNQIGGTWFKVDDNAPDGQGYVFVPTQHNINSSGGLGNIQRYFDKYEQGNSIGSISKELPNSNVG